MVAVKSIKVNWIHTLDKSSRSLLVPLFSSYVSPLFHSSRQKTKNLFNPQFGSIFRTCHNPTYFSRRLCRFSDLYMASVSCLLNYDLSYTFYPRRTPLQHEAPLWMDQLCTGCMKTPFLEEMTHIR